MKKTKTKPQTKKGTKTQLKLKTRKIKVKPKTKKQSILKKPRKKKTRNLENIDIGKLMRKHAYVVTYKGDIVKLEYLNISPSAVKEYMSRIIDATEINMQLIAERVYHGHNHKTIMGKHNKDREDIDDITDHFGERKSKVVNGDEEGVLQ